MSTSEWGIRSQFFRAMFFNWLVIFRGVALGASFMAIPAFLQMLGALPQGSVWSELVLTSTGLAFAGACYVLPATLMKSIYVDLEPVQWFSCFSCVSLAVVFGGWLKTETGVIFSPVVNFCFALLPMLAFMFALMLTLWAPRKTLTP